MRIDARWSSPFSAPGLVRFDRDHLPVIPDGGWLVGVTESGYLLEVDLHHPIMVSRREADTVGLQLWDARLDAWREHDDPEMTAYVDSVARPLALVGSLCGD
jgi:hypothetical protein